MPATSATALEFSGNQETACPALLETAAQVWQSEIVIGVIVFLFGLVIGSFLNVCIWRIPRGESIVSPPSHCPFCGALIRPWDNLPVVSWLLLRGRCRKCGERISLLYPAVELSTASLFLACYLCFGHSIEAAKWMVFSGLIVVLTITDFRERILPDKVNFMGFAAGMLFSFFVVSSDLLTRLFDGRAFHGSLPAPLISFAEAIFGAALGAGFLWLVAEAYFRLRGREGMGLGDVKMMLMAGSFLGGTRTLLTIMLASLIGSLGGVPVILCFLLAPGTRIRTARLARLLNYRRSVNKQMKGPHARDISLRCLSCRVALTRTQRYQLPFGTFLGAAALLVLFFGDPFLAWYVSLFRAR